jgi:CRISPR-associated protein (Cas_Cmr5)
MALRRTDHDTAKAAMTTMGDIKGLFPTGIPGEVFTRLAKLPVLLRTSGPLPALAFHAAKGGDGSALDQAYSVVGAALRGQVSGVLALPGPAGQPLDHAFLEALTDEFQRDPVKLARATLRLEEFSGWLRRLSEAVKKEQAAGD